MWPNRDGGLTGLLTPEANEAASPTQPKPEADEATSQAILKSEANRAASQVTPYPEDKEEVSQATDVVSCPIHLDP